MPALEATQIRDEVLSFFPLHIRDNQDVKSLANILDTFLTAKDLPTQLDSFVELKEWTASRKPSSLDSQWSRLEAFLSLMESDRNLSSRFQQVVRQILTQVRSVELFAEAGLQPREGLWSEAARRLTQRLLPSARKTSDLSRLTLRLYPNAQAIDRLTQLPDETFERMAKITLPRG